MMHDMQRDRIEALCAPFEDLTIACISNRSGCRADTDKT
jgi:hypothetical protein